MVLILYTIVFCFVVVVQFSESAGGDFISCARKIAINFNEFRYFEQKGINDVIHEKVYSR